MRKQIVLALGLILGIILNANGQRSIYPIIRTNEAQELIRENNVELTKQEKSGRDVHNFSETTIPNNKKIGLIFHILYNTEDEKLSIAQVNSQIEALNRDFNLVLPNRKHPYAKSKKYQIFPEEVDITFCLASFDGVISPINYVATNRKDWGYDNEIKNVRTQGATSFSPDQYVNIWVANMADSIGGYAQMPGGPIATDGICLLYTSPSPRDRG